MARARTLQRAFTGGVISPSVWGHIEDSKFLTGAAVMENMLPWPQGKMTHRPGTAFIAEVSDSTKTSVLRTFGAGASISYSVGIEAGLFRFYIGGASLLWATPRKVSSISTSANTITFTAAHGFTADQPVWLVKPAASTAPTGVGITVVAPMFVILVNPTTIQLAATSLGSAIDIATAGSGDLWFYADSEMPDIYVGSKNVSAINTGADSVTIASHGLATGNPVEFTATLAFTAAATDICTAAAHGLVTDTPVTVSSDGTLPPGLVAGTTYYVLVLSANTFNLLHAPAYTFVSPSNIVDITGAGSGTHTLAVAAGGRSLGSTTSVFVGETYYARRSDANTIFLHPTAADAVGGTNAIDIAGDITGGPRMHYAYLQGDLALFPNSAVYYAEIDNPKDSAPGGADWFALPFTGEYQIPNPFVESNLLNIDRHQIADTLYLSHPDHSFYGLVREADLRWKLVVVPLTPEIEPPEAIGATPTLGDYFTVSFSHASPAVFTTSQSHFFADGITTVYLNVLTGTIVGGSGFYVVATTPTDTTFTLRQFGGFTLDSGSTGTANVQESPLSTLVSNTYFVTTVRADGVESMASTPVSASNNLFVAGAYNTIAWLSVEGAERYRVYKALHGLAGFIGETYETSFKDDNIAPDMSITPPRLDDTLGVSGLQPGVISAFEQRFIFSGEESNPQSVWFTETGTVSSLIFHLPVIDTDRITFELSSPLSAAVRFIAPLTNLVILTESTEFVMTTVDSDALTPTSFKARPVSYVGCSIVKPVVVHDKLVFCANNGGHVFEFSLRAAFEGYKPVDICLRAPHLFDGYTIVDMALQKSPLPIMWFVRSDGALLGYTYSPEEEVGGWHIHTTDGQFERICVSTEDGEDRVYVIVKRTIDSNTKRFVERFASFQPVDDIEDAFHVDSGITYSGASASVITGYDHLEGEDVVANANGDAVLGLSVDGGAVTLPTSTTLAHIGLPYTGLFRSLPMAPPVDNAAGQGRQKGSNRAHVRTVNSGLYKLGVTDVAAEMVPAGVAGELTEAGEERIVLPATWSDGGQVFIQQPYPLPLQVVSIVTDVELGGG